MKRGLLLSFVLVVLAALPASAELYDWAEGPGDEDGASRDYYNQAAHLEWDNYLGDWVDESGAAQGDDAWATTTVVDDDSGRYEEWDVTALVQAWVEGTFPNKGFFLRQVGGGGTYNFRSKEHTAASERPELVIVADSTETLAPEADTYLEPSTYRSQGGSDMMRVTDEASMLLRFDLSEVTGTVTAATLRVFTYEQYGSGTIDIGVFHCNQGHDEPPSDPIPGIAAGYEEDVGIGADADVLFFADFESTDPVEGWTFANGSFDAVDVDPDNGFEALQGRALRVLMPEGENTALSLGYKFQDEVGEEPEEIYYRYYLRFGSDWNQTVDGGKMPGIAGTYDTAGWGGRPSDGTNGWSARGSFDETVPFGNPLQGRTPMGTYCYHADMEGSYGNVWRWQIGYRGLLGNNEWHSVEQYLRMNTVGEADGVIRAWIDGRLAFEKTDIRFRTVDALRIEEIWMNIYHGGTDVSPYDQHAYIDNVVIARDYIGPWMDPPTYPDTIEWPEPPPDAGTDPGTDPGTDGPDDGQGSSGCGCTLVR